MIRKFFYQLKKYTEISNFERLGIFALIFIISLVCVYQYYIHNYFYPENSIDHTRKIQEFILNDTPKNKEKSFVRSKQYSKNVNCQVKEFFNPNTDSKEQLIQKGLPSKVVENIINYRDKGGIFKVKKDLVRLYSLSKKEYQKIKPFIALPDTLIVKRNDDVLAKKPQKIIVSINSCSTDSLEKIRGIGPIFAKRIVAFRSKLGGFYSLNQLNEVYGLSQETIDMILPHLVLDSTQIKKIKLNTFSVKEISKHPYISFNEAKAIVNYRDQHGNFSHLSTLKSLHIFRDKSISRLLPYFDLN